MTSSSRIPQHILNNRAKRATSYNKMVLLIEQGANNYNEIFWYLERDLKTSVYIINKGCINLLNMRYEFYEIFLKAGAGRILEYSPEMLQHPAAEPYIKRRNDINKILQKNLISDINSIVINYLSYEMPEISTEQLASLEPIYTETMIKPLLEIDDIPDKINKLSTDLIYEIKILKMLNDELDDDLD